MDARIVYRGPHKRAGDATSSTQELIVWATIPVRVARHVNPGVSLLLLDASIPDELAGLHAHIHTSAFLGRAMGVTKRKPRGGMPTRASQAGARMKLRQAVAATILKSLARQQTRGPVVALGRTSDLTIVTGFPSALAHA